MLPVCSVPSSSGWNPYLPSVNDELKALGVDVRKNRRNLSGLRSMLGERKIFHFHWPSSYYAHVNRQEMKKAVSNWIEFLTLAGEAHCPIVWTAHNVWPHDCDFYDLHRVARQSLVAAAAHVIVHCRCAVDEITQAFGPPRRFSVIRHPSYEVAERGTDIPLPNRKKERSLSILCLGSLRRYKNLEFVAQAFSSVKASTDRLVIAGPPHQSYDLGPLREICRNDNRITLIEKQLPEPELSTLLTMSDLVLLGYSQILSSGATILAQSYGKPVVAPRLGCLTEWVPKEAGELYEANCPESLVEAIETIRWRDLYTLGSNGRRAARTETIKSFADKIRNIYLELSDQ